MQLTAIVKGGNRAYITVPPVMTPKLGLIMKMTCFLLLAACLQVSANTYSQKISFSGKQVKLEKVLAEIRQQTGYVFFYTYRLLDQAKPVSLNVKDAALDQVLAVCFKDQPLDFSIENKTIVIRQRESALRERYDSSVALYAVPPADIRGKISNEKGEPLAGAFIRVKKSRQSTVTDNKGEFLLKSIDAETAELEVSFIGYATQDLKLQGKTIVSVSMMPDVNILDATGVQVVSTGYQSVSKERTTGSFAKPDKAIFQARSTTMNVIQRLEGLVPGLTINNAPAEGQRNSVIIRGITSVNGNRLPLFVVDGLQMEDITTVNPNDIQDITVLKDATAASIWGSRASNGVIVITTKKGNTGKLTVTYDGFVNFMGKPQTDYAPVLNSRQFIQAARDVFDPVNVKWGTLVVPGVYGVSGVPPHEQILYDMANGKITAAAATASLDSLAGLDNSQQIKDLWYRNGLRTNHTLSLQGGNGKYNVYGSVAYTNVADVAPGSNTKSFKINVRQDVQVNKALSLYLITDVNNNIGKSTPNSSIRPDNRFLPYAMFKDGNGNNVSMPWLYLSDSISKVYAAKSLVNMNYTPLDEINYGYTKSDALTTRLNSGVSLRLLKGLKLEGTYGIIRSNARTRTLLTEQSYTVRSQVVNMTVPAASATAFPTYNLPRFGGRFSNNSVNGFSWTVRNQLSYDKDWQVGKHQLNLLAGQETQLQRNTTVSSTVWGYDDKLLTYSQLDYKTLINPGVNNVVYPNALGKSTLSGSPYAEMETETRYQSWYGNAAYTFNGRYTINASSRFDESNLFGRDKSAQNKPVWSIGGKWILSKEQFMMGTPWIDHLALRTTYGVTGLPPTPGSAATMDILSATAYSAAESGQLFRISTPGNRRLTWEATRTLNLGIDFSFIHHRIHGSVEGYIKKTTDLIGLLALNGFTSVKSITGNMGDLQNKGLELQLNTINIKTADFSWNSGLTLAYNTNKITSLTLSAPLVLGGDLVALGYAPGYSSAAIFSYPFAGLDAVGDPQIKLSDKSLVKARNASKPEDIIFSGTYQPKISGGFSNTFQYKNIGLSANIIFNLGHVMRRDVNSFFAGSRLVPGFGSFNSGNIHAEFNDRWRVAGDEQRTNVPSFIGNDNARNTARDINYYAQGDINVVKADFMKLRDITFSYGLPASWLRETPVGGVVFRFQVNNIMLWKANKYGIDPEFHNPASGLRTTPYAQNSVTLGVHATF